MADFAHLHLHTQYSLLDGAIRTKDLFPKVLELGMKSVAVTDHGNMFGAMDLYLSARKHGVKLIFGCETYVAATDRFDRTNRRNFHLVLLARNQAGYRNLSYLNSMGYLEGLYYNPRIDKQLLRDHSEGLIGMSACLGGEVARTLATSGVAAAEEVAREYATMFSPGDFYLELMPTATSEQQTLNEELVRMGSKLGIPLVATNDCHYVTQRDAAAHDVLMAIQMGKQLVDDKRLKHSVDSYYIKSPDEMNAHFAHVPQALENAAAIAARCEVQLELGQTYLPRYQVPNGETLESYIGTIVERGLERRFAELAARGRSFDAEIYRARCQVELGVIRRMGFAGYFLIVWDFIAWAKTQGIPVGPGRGSGAGSCVAWAMRITDIDPIGFKLLFERFLNPERVSMPDFDIDFCMRRRDEVIEYVRTRYGRDRVGQIATFHELRARGVIRDIARVMDVPLVDADRLAKLVPEPVQGKSLTIKQAIAATPELQALSDSSPMHRNLLGIADRLEGLNRHAGMHAAGIVITERPVWEHVPCFKNHGAELITQFDKDAVEKAGLIKFDFLGLKTLTVIQTAVGLVNGQRDSGPALDIDLIPDDDAAVYQLIARGDTTGVFQLESPGMRSMLRGLQPDCLDHIVAAVALYRPGPLNGGMVKTFIDRKRGEAPVTYPHPTLEPVLADTFGVIVYQEQVMEITRLLAGYSLGRADLLRRAMSKKDHSGMGGEKLVFVAAAIERGVGEQIASEVFDLLAFFADYGFNRSHAAAYAWVTYQTAYLKHHHPHELLAGLLSCADDVAEIVKLVGEVRAMELTIAGPDINRSLATFAVDAASPHAKTVRFGLVAVSGVGAGAVEVLVAERDAHGSFTSLDDLCGRVSTQQCNARVIGTLIKAGAFDAFGDRAALLAQVPDALLRGLAAARDRRSGQGSLFDSTAVVTAPTRRSSSVASVAPWTAHERLSFEKEALGFYLSGHPVDAFASELARLSTGTAAAVIAGEHGPGRAVIGGIVRDFRELLTKKGERMAIFSLEDGSGLVSCVCFPDAFANARSILVLEEPVLCMGRVALDRGGRDGAECWKFTIDSARSLTQSAGSQCTQLDVHLDGERDATWLIPDLAKILRGEPGATPVVIHIRIADRSETIIPLPPEVAVQVTDALLHAIHQLFGRKVTTLEVAPLEIPAQQRRNARTGRLV